MKRVIDADGTEHIFNEDGSPIATKDDRVFASPESLSYLYNGNPSELIKLVHERKIFKSQAEKIVDNYCTEHNYTKEQREKCLSDLKY